MKTISILLYMFMYLSLGNNKPDLKAFNHSKDSLQKLISNDKSNAEHLLELGKLYIDIKPDSAIYFIKKSIYNHYSDDNLRAQQYISMFRIYRDKGNKLLSKAYLDLALKCKINDSDLEIFVKKEQIFHFFEVAEFDSVLFYSHKLLKNSKLDKLSRQTILGNIGTLYYESGELEKAQEIFTSLIQQFKKERNLFELTKAYNNMASVYFDKNNDDSSIFYIQKLLELSKKIKEPTTEASGYYMLSQIYYYSPNYELCHFYLSKGIKLCEHEKINDLLSMLYVLKINLMFNEHIKKDKIKIEIDNLYKLTNNSIIFLKTKSSLLTLCASYYDSIGYVKDANLMYKNIAAINDTIINQNTALQLETFTEVQNLLETQKLFFHKESDINKLRQKILIFSMIIMVLIFIILFLIFNKRKNEIIETKSQELSNQKIKSKNEIENIERNSIISMAKTDGENLKKFSSILNQVSEIEKVDDVVFSIKISKLKNRIKKMVETNDVDFIKYNPIQKDFVYHLLKINPELTPNDLKICTLLRLNLSTKEIADATFLSVRTIESAKYRIRKKLNVQPGENLNLFLINIIDNSSVKISNVTE